MKSSGCGKWCKTSSMTNAPTDAEGAGIIGDIHHWVEITSVEIITEGQYSLKTPGPRRLSTNSRSDGVFKICDTWGGLVDEICTVHAMKKSLAAALADMRRRSQPSAKRLILVDP